MAEFIIGDRVWFKSKFGDRVTGTYEGDDEMPTLKGPRKVHRVSSFNAFGKVEQTPTMCIVPIGSLQRET